MKTDVPEGYKFLNIIRFELNTAIIIYSNKHFQYYKVRRTHKEIIQEIGISKFTIALRGEISCAITPDELRLASALKRKYVQYLI